MMAYEQTVAYKLLQKFETLRGQLAHYIAVIDLCPLPAFITSRNGAEIIFINSAYKRLFNVTESDLHNCGWLRIIHPDDREKVLKIWENYVITKKSGVTTSAEYRYITADQKVIPAVVSVTYFATNGIVGYVVPKDCATLLFLGMDFGCENQKAKTGSS